MSEIRDWAAENDIEVPARGPVPKAIKEQYEESRRADLKRFNDDGVEFEAGDYKPSSASPETPPSPPKKRFSLFGGGGAGKDVAPIRAPKRGHRRVSLESVMSNAWVGAGTLLTITGADVPVGRCLTFQAPAVGPMLDKALKGTIIDKALQPIARVGAQGEALSAVVLPPLLVGIIERQPALYPMLVPVLKATMATYLVAMAPVVVAQQKREQETMEAMGLMGVDLDDLVASMFAPPAERDERVSEPVA